MNLFGYKNDPVYNELRAIDPDSITPRDAMQLIYHWKKMIKGED